MTAITKIQAGIKRFPLLAKHINELTCEDESIILEYYPYCPNIFLSKRKSSAIYLYHKSGKLLKMIDDNQSVERHILNLMEKESFNSIIYIVRIKDKNTIQLYLPPPAEMCDSTVAFMTHMLRVEREKANADLEKTLAGLYPKKEACLFNEKHHHKEPERGILSTSDPLSHRQMSIETENADLEKTISGSDKYWLDMDIDPLTGKYFGPVF